jgi:hypothetical protein
LIGQVDQAVPAVIRKFAAGDRGHAAIGQRTVSGGESAEWLDTDTGEAVVNRAIRREVEAQSGGTAEAGAGLEDLTVTAAVPLETAGEDGDAGVSGSAVYLTGQAGRRQTGQANTIPPVLGAGDWEGGARVQGRTPEGIVSIGQAFSACVKGVAAVRNVPAGVGGVAEGLSRKTGGDVEANLGDAVIVDATCRTGEALAGSGAETLVGIEGNAQTAGVPDRAAGEDVHTSLSSGAEDLSGVAGGLIQTNFIDAVVDEAVCRLGVALRECRTPSLVGEEGQA